MEKRTTKNSSHPELKPWADCAPDLIAVAAGRAPADLVITGGQVVNVHTREVLNWEIAIKAGRFAYVGPDAGHCIGDSTEVIEADGQYLIPGLCDGHMHIESGMLTPAEFARAVIPHGTTTMCVDPHEIANVLGLEGVRLMHDEALLQPVNIYTQMPSCAPSAPGLETTGFEITPEDVHEAMNWPGIIGLGEMMNFPGVINSDPKMLAEMAATQAAGKTIGGHYASPDLGPNFHAYAAGGPADDHEGTCELDAIARARQGMRVMMRLGSAWFDVEKQITAVTEQGLDPRNFILCTDDCHSGTLVEEGHMNRALRYAISYGCDPLVALQMATINTATHFGLERELGSITPGRRADVIFTDDLTQLPINRVIARGQVVAEAGEIKVDCPHLDWPNHAKATMHLGRDITEADFVVDAPEGKNSVTAKVIGIVENQAPTKALTRDLAVINGRVEPDELQDVAQVALVERHKGTGAVQNGFVNGFGYRGQMAMASTVAHDSHHMIVVGTSRHDMALAANRLAQVGGGMCVYKDGQELALVELPVAGLMSDAPAPEVAVKAQGIVKAMEACGCTLNNASIQHSFLALVVIPELRISDLGLVDVNRFELTGLFED
ncbi:Adenine deaminase [Aliiroseovarius sp. xm-m-379]|uniref:adenine deaminase n=1 Tax=unclassified Aliiroseovarius TaxID=2623558 RepID=UPI001569AB13|nr:MULTISPECIES: adenine deaminase [unclassified Aliiroseovarius]NRP13189.1 Adenine deaminase [Aliiroseovarius sp. xm-d-517]NRP23979.1 Adenine deaminase [Aliiroseovarius sp. xm-m-379]NRP30211.1 Adenine deaminase [Aliiroseovarius sp. xm-m-314]NRP32778.1 Adenine deaminase [Aliiroseovarius sp. xm-a-104]NRP40336.1 Adenine deaminase [Aliiroseovarius sp. xm-m-339-2]